MTIYTKLAKARKMLQESGLKKTGKGYKFTYYALEDFLPRTNEVFEELGLCSFTQIQPDEFNGVLVAKMIIADDDGGEIIFAVPYAEAVLEGQAGKNPVQNLGAAITYLTRYLWVQVLAISEFDQVDGAIIQSSVSPQDFEEKQPSRQVSQTQGPRTRTVQNPVSQQPMAPEGKPAINHPEMGEFVKGQKLECPNCNGHVYVNQNKSTTELFIGKCNNCNTPAVHLGPVTHTV